MDWRILVNCIPRFWHQYQITVNDMKHHLPIGDIRAHDRITVELVSTCGICSYRKQNSSELITLLCFAKLYYEIKSQISCCENVVEMFESLTSSF
jgi:hypothetical protein